MSYADLFPPATHCVLYDGSTIATVFFDHVHRHLDELLPTLTADRRYSATELLDEEFMNTLEDYQRHVAALCLAYMPELELVPVCCDEAADGETKRYRVR